MPHLSSSQRVFWVSACSLRRVVRCLDLAETLSKPARCIRRIAHDLKMRAILVWSFLFMFEVVNVSAFFLM